VTFLTTLKIIAAKSPLAVVTTQAAQGAFGGGVLGGNRRRDLSLLRLTCFHLMALPAIRLLVFPMSGMAEIDLKCPGENRRAAVTAGPMTGAARGDIPPCRLRALRVTLITNPVCGEARRDGKRHIVAPGWFMTGRAVGILVPLMIEFHIETGEAREGFEIGFLGCRIAVTDRADWTGGIGKLLCVTSRTGRMPGPFRFTSRR
jgi:hypothetical protein